MRLGQMIADYRWANHIGIRDLAKEIGTSPATLSRFERGENCDARTLTLIVAYIFGDGLARPKRRQQEPHP